MIMINGPQPNGDGAKLAFDKELEYMAHCEWLVFYPEEKYTMVKALLKEARKRNICVPS